MVRVLCFFLGRERMPTASRTLTSLACEPTISLFDPPTYIVATLREAIASLTEACARDESPRSTAFAPPGLGQPDVEPPWPIGTTFAQDLSSNPRQNDDRRYVARPAGEAAGRAFLLG
jgi:hypothetical protein